MAGDGRVRARDLGLVLGSLPPGRLDAITDVEGVLVGHASVVRGDTVRTGVTAILPHGGDLYRRKVAAGSFVANGHSKVAGLAQVRELGTIEAPIVLTNTLAVGTALTAVIRRMLGLPGNGDVRSINVVVGETNDGGLNDIRSLPVTEADVVAALDAARPGPVEEGCVGAGVGTESFGYKAGIGTASRRTPAGWTLGVLVQSNLPGVLTVPGLPPIPSPTPAPRTDGSCIVVVATDAPADARTLDRIASRAFAGVIRIGSSFATASGEVAVVFSTARDAVRIPDAELDALFLAAIESTAEAVLDSLTTAHTTTGTGRTVEALPLALLGAHSPG
jgi:D-aminopeptidase